MVGDGMSLTTATAARILRGQRRGQTGEDTDLAWDTFPAVALAKVCINLRARSHIVWRWYGYDLFRGYSVATSKPGSQDSDHTWYMFPSVALA